MPSGKITAAALEKLPVGKTLWDTEVRGLGAMRSRLDMRFVFKGRLDGTQILMRIGRWGRGDYGIDDARKVATGWRLTIREGRDPRGEPEKKTRPMTVSELCDAYLEAVPTLLLRKQRRPKRESTIDTDRSRIEAHVKPLLGSKPVPEVTRADVETFMHRVAAGETAKPRGKGRGQPARGGQGTATRTVGLLGAIFSYAMNRNLRADNPVRGVIRYADQKRERRLSNEEYRALASGLAQMQARYPVAVACLRFLAVSGWRRGEAVRLKWAELDDGRRTAILGDTKTGRSMRPLAHAALGILADQPPTYRSEWVFPASHGNGAIGSLPRVWDRVRKAAGLPDDITPHTLRHSAASLASDLGLSEATIAGLLGHKLGTVTGRYTHSADATLLAAADRVADTVLELMEGQKKDSAVVTMHSRS